MHLHINVKSPNNISKWQVGFNSTFEVLTTDITIAFCLYTEIPKTNMLKHTNYKNSLSKFGYCICTNIVEIYICTNNKYIGKNENTLNAVSNIDT
jgi:hypothetical protein